ncbi:type I methionyl aminopeptidase [Celeribacter halophilus]|uniref:type I methionyl aminopeptidase n=1 Tax=Celeribacter halophilus TaxID=576117 RepID=UPI003A950B72
MHTAERSTITRQDELDGLKDHRIVANTLQAMARAMEPGMTTELTRSACLDRAGAVRPRRSMTFLNHLHQRERGDRPLHSRPRRIAAATQNIDVGVEERLCRYRRQLVNVARIDRPAGTGGAPEVGSPGSAATARLPGSATPSAGLPRRGYTLVRNLASHGVGRSLHEYPEEIATWLTCSDRRRIDRGWS